MRLGERARERGSEGEKERKSERETQGLRGTGVRPLVGSREWILARVHTFIFCLLSFVFSFKQSRATSVYQNLQGVVTPLFFEERGPGVRSLIVNTG